VSLRGAERAVAIQGQIHWPFYVALDRHTAARFAMTEWGL